MRKILGFIALIVVLFGLALLNQERMHRQVEREYLQENRPDVVAAINAYHAANGQYPASLTNAIPKYYHGDQERIFYMKNYAYKDLGTNYHLKSFAR